MVMGWGGAGGRSQSLSSVMPPNKGAPFSGAPHPISPMSVEGCIGLQRKWIGMSGFHLRGVGGSIQLPKLWAGGLGKVLN